MSTRKPADSMDLLENPPEFSLVQGGPLFQLLVRSRLTTPALELVKRRIVCITLFAWLPLLFLSLVAGKAFGGAGLPFLYDIEMQVRFLVALPLLIGAELLVHRGCAWSSDSSLSGTSSPRRSCRGSRQWLPRQ